MRKSINFLIIILILVSITSTEFAQSQTSFSINPATKYTKDLLKELNSKNPLGSRRDHTYLGFFR